ncbi:HAD family hydrolase [Limosilactobacillus gastricus]|uniref:HAD family hydrolase n=1 Tax=Limosilactobacillus gastricus TaxID=227942 RepID=UPI00030F5C46|nr:HAD family hydrolase [Limosilactobacillus gastricus]
MIKNYFFDFDRTLADSGMASVHATQAAFQDSNLDVPSEAEISSYMGMPAPDSFPQMANRNLLSDEINELVRKFRQFYIEYEDQDTSLYNGMLETLASLKENGKNMFVVSAKETKALKRNLTKLGIDQYFKEAVGFDVVKHPKPAPDALLMLIDQYQYSLDESVMIGDAKYDIQMGKSAHIKTCGVIWGAHDVDELKAEKPDFLINQPRDLLELA